MKTPMSRSTDARSLRLDLTLNERWTLHHRILDRIEREMTSADVSPPPIEVYRVFDKLETGTDRFTADELRGVRSELEEAFSSDLPARDERALRTVLDRIDEALRETCAPSV